MNRLKLTIVFLFFCLVSFGQLKNGIEMYLKFEGTTGRDERNQNTATPTNVTTGATGKVGLAWDFNGTTSHADASDNASLSFINTMTISCWVYPESTDNNYVCIKADDLASVSDELEYRLQLGTSNSATFGASSDGDFTGSTSITGTDDSTPVDTWTHVVALYNGSNLLIYINGALDATSVSFTSNLYQGTADLHIGARFDDSESIYKFFFDGLIDELIVSKLAWNQNFISQHFADDNGRKYVWENFINGKITYSEWLEYDLKCHYINLKYST